MSTSEPPAYVIGDLVYAYDTYRGIIGTITAIHPPTSSHPWFLYSIDIIKKTQPSFYAKRWDNEMFSEGEVHHFKYQDDGIILDNGRIVDIMSDIDIVKFQSENYPFFKKLINNFGYFEKT